MRQDARFRNYRLWIHVTLETVALILLIVLLVRIVVQNYHVNGQSMEPTLHNQEYMLVNKAAYLFHPPERGDVIVFQAPPSPTDDYVKRIVAIPGDSVSIINQTVIINGITLHENYINKDDLSNPYPPLLKRVVGPDQYFVLGDNRGNSSDSRQWGFVPRRNIIGKVIMVYWPFNEDNFGLLPDESGVFAKVRH